MEYCKLCGTPLEDGICPNTHAFNKMCLNCADCQPNDGDGFICVNEKNKEKAQGDAMKALEAAGIKSYKITIALEPVPLKKPTCKCPNWTLSEDVAKEVVALFK